MNGYECGMCDQAPCVCSEIEYNKRVSEGKIVIESIWQAIIYLPNWKMKIIKWIWPDIVHVVNDILTYYLREKK